MDDPNAKTLAMTAEIVPRSSKTPGSNADLALVLERGLLDAAEKPAAEARPHQVRPVDLEDLAWAAHPAEPRGVALPAVVTGPVTSVDPSQPFDPLMRSVQVRPQIKDLFPWRPHLDNEAMVTHACSLVRPVSPAVITGSTPAVITGWTFAKGRS